MNQPPGSLLSSEAVQTYGKTVNALRKFTQASLNKEPLGRKHLKDTVRAENAPAMAPSTQLPKAE